MKKLLMIIAACQVLMACHNRTPNDPSKANSIAQQNLKAVHNISKAFENGDTSLIDRSVAPDFVDHRAYGDVRSIDSLKAFVLSSHEHIKNLKIETAKELADDEYVMTWTEFSGTGDGQANTLPGDFNVKGVEITRLKNGKAIEHWEAMDMRDVYKMMQKMAANDVTPDSTNTQ
jgi:hypothetical protein